MMMYLSPQLSTAARALSGFALFHQIIQFADAFFKQIIYEVNYA
jgi:hypothetical protein